MRPFEGEEDAFEESRANLEGQDVVVAPALTGLAEAVVVREPGGAALASRAPEGEGDAETDFAGVLDAFHRFVVGNRSPWIHRSRHPSQNGATP